MRFVKDNGRVRVCSRATGRAVIETDRKRAPAPGISAPGTPCRRLSLRVALIALVIAGVLPVLAFAAWMVGRAAALERAAVQAHLVDTARATALGIDQRLAEYRAVLTTLANAPALDTDDLATFHRLALSAERPDGAWINLSDRSGQQLLNTRRPLGAALPLRAQPETVRRVSTARSRWCRTCLPPA